MWIRDNFMNSLDVEINLIRKSRRRLRFCGGVVLGFLLLLATPSKGETLYDQFNDNSLNENLWWADVTGTGPTVQEINGRLEITFPANSSGVTLMAGVGSEFELMGDFDARVDFDLLNWPEGNGFNVSLTTGVNFTISRYSYTFWDHEGYLLYSAGNMFSVPASETSGKLRIKRTGNTMEAFYWQNDAWQSIGASSNDQFAGKTNIGLNADCGNPSRFTGQLVKIGFRNFQVTDQLGAAMPFLPLLLD